MTLDDLVAAGKLASDRSLADLTTYRFGGPARYFAEVASREELASIVDARMESGAVPLLVVGRGSNMVVSDSGFPGLVLRLGGEFREVALGRDGIVDAGAAASVPKLARIAARDGRGGLEFFVGVPGSVGGAVRMNAGCHGSDTSGSLVTATIVDLESGSSSERTPVDLGLGYRTSNLDDEDLVVAARFRTVTRSPDDAEARMREITRWRKENQPGGTLNAGSVFKNPDAAPAGEIIDDAGLKGFTVGGASVSERHANFFVAGPSATAQDVFDLVNEVRGRVADATGIELEPEIRFVGEFVRAGKS